MGQKINGLSFDCEIGDYSLHAEKFSLEITDNSAVVLKNGRPDGDVNGSVEASGEIEIDAAGLKVLAEAAGSAGSFQDLPRFDLVGYAKLGDDEVKIEAFECKLKIGSLLDVDKSSSDPTKIAIPFIVTGKDFVHINGVPYIKPEES